MYGSFIAEHPEHLARHKIEENITRCEDELAKCLDRTAFSDVKRTAMGLINQHKYQEALDLYEKYMDQYSEHENEARKMIEVTIPKLIEDEPRRKRRVKRNLIVDASALSVLALIIGFNIWGNVQESKRAEENYQLGGEEFKVKNYRAAVTLFLDAAEHGHAGAQYNLGVMYDKARGVLSRDGARANSWYKKAAAQGHAEAQYCLGLMYKDKTVAVPNYSWANREAMKWFRKAAEQGNEAAQKQLDAMTGNKPTAPDATVAQEPTDSSSGPSDDFWPLVDQYSPGAREMNRNADPVLVEYLDAVDKQTGLTNRERAEAAMKSNDPKAMAAIFDECKYLSSGGGGGAEGSN